MKSIARSMPAPFWISFYILLVLIILPVLAYIGTISEAVPNTITVTTSTATNITQTTATLSGMTTPEGIVYRGFQYGTDTNYGLTAEDETAIQYSFARKWSTQGQGLASPIADIESDSEDSIYITFGDPGTKIIKYNDQGDYVTEWNGSTTASGSFSTYGFAIDEQDNVYVTDRINQKVLKYNNQGTLLFEFGDMWSGDTLNEPGFQNLRDIEIDSAGNIYANDSSRIVKYDSAGNFIKAWGRQTGPSSFLSGSWGLVIDSQDRIYVNEGGAVQHIVKFDTEGNELLIWGSAGTADGQFRIGQTKIAIDSNDHVFVNNSTMSPRVQEFTSQGVFVRKFGGGGSGDGQFASPRGIAIDSNDVLYATDVGRIQAFSAPITATLTDLECGTTYHYRAGATNGSYVGYGEDKSFVTADCDVQLQVPSAPQNPSITNSSITSLQLNWQVPISDGGSPVTAYQVEYKQADSSAWIPAPLQDPTPTSHVLINLSPNTTYDFRVAAINNIGTSPYSTPVAGTTLTPATSPEPEAPVIPVDPDTPVTNTETNQPTPGSPRPPIVVTPISPQTTVPNDDRPAPITTSLTSDVIGSEIEPSLPIPLWLAGVIPWSLLALLLAITGLYSYSSYQEDRRRAVLQILSDRLKATLAARAIYLRITSHYINTPLTKIQGVIELLAAGVSRTDTPASSSSTQMMSVAAATLMIPHDTITKALELVRSLSEHTEELLYEGQSLTGSQQANVRYLERHNKLSFLSHPAFWLPAAIIPVLTMLANILFIRSGTYEASLINLAVQIGVCVVGIIALGVSYYFLQASKAAAIAAKSQASIEQDLTDRQLQFMANASLALRNDLSALSGLSNDVSKYPHTDGFKEGIDQLQKILTQFDTLQELSRSVPGLIYKTDITKVATEAIASVRELADGMQVTVNITMPSKLPLVNMEEKALLHLIAAPLKNAIQASPQGSRVELEVLTRGDRIQLTITDRGPGIPESSLATIFDPFNSATSTERFTDTGLGLDIYLAQVISKQYGTSHIAIENRKDGGAKVTLLLS